jgi:hypothetical protein
MPGGVTVVGESLEDTGRESWRTPVQGKWAARQGIQHVRNSNISHLAEVREMSAVKAARRCRRTTSLGCPPPL